MEQIGQVRILDRNGSPTTPSGENCGTCRYFMPRGNPSIDLSAPQAGLCRRYPPVAQILGMIANANPKMPPIPQVGCAVPQVHSPDWCGEFAVGSND